MKAPIILAVDTSDFDTALAWIDNTKESVSVYKLVLEFYLNYSNSGISRIVNEPGVEIFLDFKQLDIPHTVAGAIS